MIVNIVVPISQALWHWTWDADIRDDFRRAIQAACFGIRPIVVCSLDKTHYQARVGVSSDRSHPTVEHRLKDVIAAWETRCADALDRIEGL